MSASVIVLNRNYEYWTEASIQKVVKWLLKKKIEVVVAADDREIGGLEIRFKMPLVVRLLEFVGYKPRSETIPESDDAVFARDNNFCQYWHHADGRRFMYKCTTEDRTIDHVTPTSRGGSKNSFTNKVCCCRWHNEIVKKNHTPEEAGLELVRKPFVPRRSRSDYVVMRFAFNPRKLAHKVYVEQVLGGVV
jgi:hypothetical protein